MLSKISLAIVLIIVGGTLTIVGGVAYAANNPTLNLAGFFYGIPILLGGFALKSAELEPIPYTTVTSDEIVTLRDKLATTVQNQIRKDVTRFRYGQEAHLDIALEKLGLSPTDEERPVLEGLREVVINNKYALILEFYSPLISLDIWREKQEKIARFFGPDITVEIEDKGENRLDISLISQLA